MQKENQKKKSRIDGYLRALELGKTKEYHDLQDERKAAKTNSIDKYVYEHYRRH